MVNRQPASEDQSEHVSGCLLFGGGVVEIHFDEGIGVIEDAHALAAFLDDAVVGDGRVDHQSIGELHDDGEDDAADADQQVDAASEFSLVGVLSVEV